MNCPSSSCVCCYLNSWSRQKNWFHLSHHQVHCDTRRDVASGDTCRLERVHVNWPFITNINLMCLPILAYYLSVRRCAPSNHPLEESDKWEEAEAKVVAEWRQVLNTETNCPELSVCPPVRLFDSGRTSGHGLRRAARSTRYVMATSIQFVWMNWRYEWNCHSRADWSNRLNQLSRRSD